MVGETRTVIVVPQVPLAEPTPRVLLRTDPGCEPGAVVGRRLWLLGFRLLRVTAQTGSNRLDTGGRQSARTPTWGVFLDALRLGVGGEGGTFQCHLANLVEGLAGGAEARQLG